MLTDLRRAKGGFTLVEVLVVVAILSVLAVLAIPDLSGVRLRGNETAAVANLRILVSALDTFRLNQTPVTYPGSSVSSGGTTVDGIEDLDNLNPPYIDPVLAGGTKQGYVFAYAAGSSRTVTLDGTNYSVYDDYTITALPQTAGTTGKRTFFVNQTGVVRVDAAGGTPTVSDPPLE
ncbi:MAG: hypothetical protein COV76_04150 [Candidatus Omnitrophica bacterium CG11_big_fil_rev_8_21_14_0_20_64_10]|nr:MAG: hypothetical protein COV76_04150 [Candidatus Omnitrophica bacterium CG11_big_fil_rev_8_21_14_0_20_64_10]